MVDNKQNFIQDAYSTLWQELRRFFCVWHLSVRNAYFRYMSISDHVKVSSPQGRADKAFKCIPALAEFNVCMYPAHTLN